MKNIRIFLASSKRLKGLRDKIQLNIATKNKILNSKNIFLELTIWEDLSKVMAHTRSQNEYNKEIKISDFFVLLASDEIGEFTEEEFDIAYNAFIANNKPKILTFFNDTVFSRNKRLSAFKKKLADLGHFSATYSTDDNLWNKINIELDIFINAMDISNNKILKEIGINPPGDPAVFFGRDINLIEIHKIFFKDKKNVLLVNGNGGIGKTTLARRYYYQYMDEYEHLIWVVNQNGIDMAILDLAKEVHITLDSKGDKTYNINKVIKRLNELDKPTLFIIDNVDDYGDLDNNYHYLLKIPKLHILITSRITDYQNFEKHHLGKLKPEDAKELFIKLYRFYNEDEESILESVLEAVNYNTLVITLLSKNLSYINNKYEKLYGISELLRDLRTKGLFGLSKTTKVDTNYRGIRKEKPEDIIKAMYSLADLDEDKNKILSVFSLIPNNNVPFQDTLEFLDIEDLGRKIEELETQSWLETNGNNHIRMNPLIAEIIRDKNKEHLFDDNKKFIEKIADILEYEANTGIVKDYNEVTRFAKYGEGVLKYINKSDYILPLLTDRLGSFHKTYGLLDKALEYFQEQTQLFKELYTDNPSSVDFKNGLAVSYSRLGNVYKRLGEINKALKYFEEYNRLTKELYQDNPSSVDFKNGLAASYQFLGDVYKKLGETDKALNCFEEFNRLTKEHYQDNPSSVDFKYGLAVSCQILGDVYKKLGETDKALKCFDEFNRLTKELYQDNPGSVDFKNGLAVSYQFLGNVYTRLGEINEALKYFEEFNLLTKELYQDNSNSVDFKNGLAISYSKLGDVYTRLVEINKALKCFEEESKLFEELYTDNPIRLSFKNGLATSYVTLGLLLIEEINETEKGKEYIIDAMRLYDELQKDFPQYPDFKEKYEYSVKYLNDL